MQIAFILQHPLLVFSANGQKGQTYRPWTRWRQTHLILIWMLASGNCASALAWNIFSAFGPYVSRSPPLKCTMKASFQSDPPQLSLSLLEDPFGGYNYLEGFEFVTFTNARIRFIHIQNSYPTPVTSLSTRFIGIPTNMRSTQRWLMGKNEKLRQCG